MSIDPTLLELRSAQRLVVTITASQWTSTKRDQRQLIWRNGFAGNFLSGCTTSFLYDNFCQGAQFCQPWVRQLGQSVRGSSPMKDARNQIFGNSYVDVEGVVLFKDSIVLCLVELLKQFSQRPCVDSLVAWLQLDGSLCKRQDIDLQAQVFDPHFSFKHHLHSTYARVCLYTAVPAAPDQCTFFSLALDR